MRMVCGNTKLLLMILLCVIGGYFFININHSSPVIVIQSYEEVQDIFNRVSSDTLVLFDVDDTLIQSSSDDFAARGIEAWPWWWHIWLIINYPSVLLPTYWEWFYSVMWQQTPRYIIEPEVISLIAYAQKRGCPVLALTGIESGEYGVIESFPEWRYEMLAHMGILFSQPCPDMKFDTLPLYRNTYPILYKGILCANHQPKGMVLKAFLAKCVLQPAHIIFFDDTYANLQSVGGACAQLGIPCTLYHYTGARYQKDSLDFYVFKQHVEHVWTTGHWLLQE